MFNLMKVKKKSTGRAPSQPTPSPPAQVPIEAAKEHPTHGGEKRPGGGGSEPAHRSKGKEPVEAAKSPNHPSTMRELYEVDDRARKDRYFITQIFELPRLEAEGSLKLHWPNLTAGSRVERLKAALGEFEQHCKDHELAADSARGELKDLRESQRWLEDEVLSLTQNTEVLWSELKIGGDKAVTEYKVTFEFGYRVVLERFRAKYPDLFVEEDPFVERPKDANVHMEMNQPFNDSTPLKD
ncbi:hypothetical protein GW17_00033617 [Ensete ventricosum]|nr:hypothetical protein GW17_00033617 [Ensete ventricosum]